MLCSSCYSETNEHFCRKCRIKLFDGAKLSSILPFKAPKEDNFEKYHQHTKRLSISGVQLKYSLRLESTNLVLSEDNGQYILKPIPPARQLQAIDDAPENEHLTMQIAEQIFKIRTAPNALLYFEDGQPAYITRRFDLKTNQTKYLQEDFAQLLARSSDSHGQNYKYDGTYDEIGTLIKKYVAAAPPALEELFKHITFNYFISNGDAHLKNFSLMLLETGEYRLTPAYDLMCTKLHTPYESDTALELFEDCMDSDFYNIYGFHGRSDFMAFAKRLNLVEKRAKGMLNKFMASENLITSMVEKSALSDSSKNLYLKNLRDRILRMG